MLLAAILLVMMPFTVSAATEPLDEIRQLVRENYVDEVPASVLEKGTAEEIMKALDVYSVYMSKEEFAAFTDGIEQRIVGIGVVLEEDKNGVRVLAVIENGPASVAGIIAGDLLTYADGISLKGKSVQAAIPLISGDENTEVTLDIERVKEERIMKFKKTIRRAEIHLPTVESEMLGGNIGYIRLNSFAADSGKEVARALGELGTADSIIFDIRNNGGGYITAAQEVTGFFPEVAEAFQLREKNKKPSIYPAVNQRMKIEEPVSLLVNEFSASASEMLAVNLKEAGAATVYGQNTYGKGTMQTMYAFPDGSVLKLTTARFYSPKGIAVNGIGISPDVVTNVGEELTTAHFDHLLLKVKGYAHLSSLENVQSSKTFTVQMTKEMDWSTIDRSAIELVELGGKAVPVKITVKNGKTINIIPERPLLSGASYMLIIHPGWLDRTGLPVKSGIYLNVTVK